MCVAALVGRLAANTSLKQRVFLLGTLSGVLLAPACVHEESTKPKHAGQETRPIAIPPGSDDPAFQLGVSTLEIVNNAERVLFADLASVSADEAQDPSSLRDSERVAGYPPLHELRELTPEDARLVAAKLTDGSRYDPELLLRCLPEHRIGFRFVRQHAWVDAMLTDTCTQVAWSFVRAGSRVVWGAAYSPEHGAQLRALTHR